jgi:hypothetical protein
VSSQKDAEEADIEKERTEQAKGPAAQQRELEELTQIYIAVCNICQYLQCCAFVYKERGGHGDISRGGPFCGCVISTAVTSVLISKGACGVCLL